jgi:hypothetical protein
VLSSASAAFVTTLSSCPCVPELRMEKGRQWGYKGCTFIRMCNGTLLASLCTRAMQIELEEEWWPFKYSTSHRLSVRRHDVTSFYSCCLTPQSWMELAQKGSSLRKVRGVRRNELWV